MVLETVPLEGNEAVKFLLEVLSKLPEKDRAAVKIAPTPSKNTLDELRLPDRALPALFAAAPEKLRAALSP